MKGHSDFNNKYTDDDIIRMLRFLIDNIFVDLLEKVSVQIVGVSMGIICAPLFVDIVWYSFETEFI